MEPKPQHGKGGSETTRAPSLDWPRAAAVWEEFPAAVAAWHFGSSARGTARLDSDVDVAVLLAPGTPSWVRNDALIVQLAQLQARLQQALRVPKLDLVVLNEQGLVFQHQVLRTGHRVFERDRRARILFETQVISRYCDFLPTLRLVERYQGRGLRTRAGLS